MSRRTIAVSLAAAGTVAAIAATNGSAQAPEGRTLTFYEQAKNSTFTLAQHKPKQQQPKIGDHIVLGLPLYDEAGAKQGVARATCSITGRPGNGQLPMVCSGVFALPDGDIAVLGRVVSPGVNRLAVVGGTGAYAGARGTLTSTDTSSGATDVLNLLP
jgi:Dirigent-like protein